MSYLKHGLTIEDASNICIERCGAQCCQGPLVLCLSEEERLVFKNTSDNMGTSLKITPFGESWIVKFEDHQGDCCPMLDIKTMKCLNYEHRPRQCKEFPSRPIKGCEISSD